VRRLALALALLLWAAPPALARSSTLFVIKGAGWGNGLGLSQWGAQGYAAHGWDYRRILAHYYPHTTLATVAEPDVRVLLAEQQPAVQVGSSAPFLLVDARNRKVHLHARTLRFGTKLRLGKHALVPPVTAQAGMQPLTFDGRAYRGTLTLQRGAGGFTVVNTVPLELYLRGVVPSEMPRGWLAQAYEAQAVASRSYAIAVLDASRPFDVYGDSRSQVYGGIAAERPWTNAAIGETAGEAVTYEGRVVTAYYDSDAGGRTAAVEDVFPGAAPQPYLSSVSDPYDSQSPYRRWRLGLTAEELSTRVGVEVDDVRVDHGASGVARQVLVVGGGRSKTVTAGDFVHRLQLRSPRFSVCVLSLDQPTRGSKRGQVELHGFLRDIAGVVLQGRTSSGGWRQLARVHARPDGRFTLTIRAHGTTAYRLAVDQMAGLPVVLPGRR
jgi:SpoIID/LytB domain protein